MTKGAGYVKKAVACVGESRGLSQSWSYLAGRFHSYIIANLFRGGPALFLITTTPLGTCCTVVPLVELHHSVQLLATKSTDVFLIVFRHHITITTLQLQLKAIRNAMSSTRLQNGYIINIIKEGSNPSYRGDLTIYVCVKVGMNVGVGRDVELLFCYSFQRQANSCVELAPLEYSQISIPTKLSLNKLMMSTYLSCTSLAAKITATKCIIQAAIVGDRLNARYVGCKCGRVLGCCLTVFVVPEEGAGSIGFVIA
ncbi:unnamed protein product [Cercopithifilaria johnstoni]|uniref:Uncharacterized protein n=1 Tax=Cercopithifilaria johnstoni TaxID=2874296 RepID=A0A8J2MF68_9BILA|nr:unnamed protein product [Cercopithifilaria johnstoni]